jgi:enoyl-[acyl-carrier protein] reductase II
MGWIARAPLASAVSNAGGMGIIETSSGELDVIREEIRRMRTLTDKPFGVNLITMHPQLTDLIAICAQYKVTHVVLAGGLPPAGAIEQIKAFGTKVICFAPALSLAKKLVRAGVDALVIEGMEAGGHRGTFLRPFDESMIGVMALTSMAVQATHLPVVAAGGLMTGGAIRAVLDLGASAASMGTAFLLCEEAGTSMAHRYMLALEQPRPTVITRAFSGRPARGIINRFHEQISAVQDRCAPFPALNDMTRDIRRAAANAGDPEALSLWAGQAYPLVRDMPAASLMAVLLDEAKWFGA